MARRRRRLCAAGAAVLLSLASCTATLDPAPGPIRTSGSTPRTPSAAPSPPPGVKVAFIRDGAPGWALERGAPAFQGAKLAFETAALAGGLPVEVELVALDTGGDPETAAAVAREVAEDPGYVGAIGAPFLTGQVTVGEILDAAGVPFVTLSPLGPELSRNGWSAWRRAVANQERVGAVVAAFVDSLPGARRGACLFGDGSPESSGLLRAVAGPLVSEVTRRAEVTEGEAGSARVAGRVARAGCGVVVWGGSSREGALVRRELVDAGLREVAFVGGDRMMDGTYLSVAGSAGRGTVAACPCVDLSTSTEFAAQRFIQDYQSDFGLAPGPYAAEAWDVARMFVQALRQGAVTRSEMREALLAVDGFPGLANTYRFAPGGELAPGAAPVHLFRAEGGRWIPVEGP